jgi:hypothetical protein
MALVKYVGDLGKVPYRYLLQIVFAPNMELEGDLPKDVAKILNDATKPYPSVDIYGGEDFEIATYSEPFAHRASEKFPHFEIEFHGIDEYFSRGIQNPDEKLDASLAFVVFYVGLNGDIYKIETESAN